MNPEYTVFQKREKTEKEIINEKNCKTDGHRFQI